MARTSAQNLPISLAFHVGEQHLYGDRSSLSDMGRSPDFAHAPLAMRSMSSNWPSRIADIDPPRSQNT